jgi:hypothetical protein
MGFASRWQGVSDTLFSQRSSSVRRRATAAKFARINRASKTNRDWCSHADDTSCVSTDYPKMVIAMQFQDQDLKKPTIDSAGAQEVGSHIGR